MTRCMLWGLSYPRDAIHYLFGSKLWRAEFVIWPLLKCPCYCKLSCLRGCWGAYHPARYKMWPHTGRAEAIDQAITSKRTENFSLDHIHFLTTPLLYNSPTHFRPASLQRRHATPGGVKQSEQPVCWLNIYPTFIGSAKPIPLPLTYYLLGGLCLYCNGYCWYYSA